LKKWRKEKIFAVRWKLKRTAKTNGRLLQKWRKEKIFAVRPKLKRTAKKIRRTAESFFAVRPIKDARQRFERTAKNAFPVVIALRCHMKIDRENLHSGLLSYTLSALLDLSGQPYTLCLTLHLAETVVKYVVVATWTVHKQFMKVLK
jgi:hypothetical protein